MLCILRERRLPRFAALDAGRQRVEAKAPAGATARLRRGGRVCLPHRCRPACGGRRQGTAADTKRLRVTVQRVEARAVPSLRRPPT